nr:molybdate ABC transporter substrate-binding protein [Schlegelella koreensis]
MPLLLFAGFPEAARAADLTVSVASSLTQAFRELAQAFEASERGTTVRVNVGSSGALLQQMVHGAPVDVFASADERTMDEAERRGLLVPGTRIPLATNQLTLVVPRAALEPPAALADLQRAPFRRIAIGQPTSVPAGLYAKGALERAGLWGALEPRLVMVHSVRQALDYVARGEVDAGFVYATDAALLPDAVRVAFTVPTDPPVRYPLALVAGGPSPVTARRFFAFVTTPAAQAVLARHGFGKP